MKASFDGIRKQLAWCFNQLAKTSLSNDQRVQMEKLRGCIASLMCMYDDNDDDCNDLSNTVHLEELSNQGDNHGNASAKSCDKNTGTILT